MSGTDSESRIFYKLDQIDNKINDLCTRTAVIEERLGTHLTLEEKKQAHNWTKFKIALTLVSLGISAVTGLNVFGFI